MYLLHNKSQVSIVCKLSKTKPVIGTGPFRVETAWSHFHCLGLILVMGTDVLASVLPLLSWSNHRQKLASGVL